MNRYVSGQCLSIAFWGVVVMMAFVADARAQLENTSIVFVSSRDGNPEVYIMDADGSNPVNLTNHPSVDGEPSWSPDGSKIVFGSYRDGNPEVYVMDSDGSNPVNLTNHPAFDGGEPSWSPDGSKIAFRSDRSGNDEIYVMDADGSNPVNLTNHPLADGEPSWSPDGSKIAFGSYRDGNAEIYVMDADGSNPANLTNHPLADFLPAWSPDGARIAFVSARGDGDQEIYVMDADGGNPVNVTDHPSSDQDPAWSPDASKIAFLADRDGNFDIYVMDADGSNPVNLTNHLSADSNPFWSPFPPSGPVILGVGSALGAPGDTLRVPFSLTNTTSPVGGVQADVTLTDTLAAHFVGVEDTTGNPGFTVFINTTTAVTRLVVFSTSNAVIPTGTDQLLATLVYTIDPATAPGTDIPLTLSNTEVSDSLGVTTPDTTLSGALQVGLRGDLTQDGEVSVVDVIRLVRIIIGREPTPAAGSAAFNLADMNQDGVLDIADVIAQVNDILTFPKVIATGPTQPVVISLDALQTMESGQFAIPVMLESNGLIAGMQAAFTFAPALIEVGTPQLTGAADGLTFDSHVVDGTLRVIVYGVTPGTGIAAGQGAALLIPVTVREGVTGSGTLTLSDIILVDPQAQQVPVLLGEVTIPVAKEGASLPTAFALNGNAPNPFNPATTISYEVPAPAHITLTVYNLLGQEVVRLVNQAQVPGRYVTTWYGRNARGQAVASGVYLYRLTSSTGYSESKRMTLLK